MAPNTSPDIAVADVRGRLRRKFADCPGDVVDSAVADAVAALSTAPVRSFIPVLVERQATAVLEQRHPR